MNAQNPSSARQASRKLQHPAFDPPPTDEKITSSGPHTIKEIRNRRQGHTLTSAPCSTYELDPIGFRDLEQQLQSDELLGICTAQTRVYRITTILTSSSQLINSSLQTRLFPQYRPTRLSNTTIPFWPLDDMKHGAFLVHHQP
jgi:hypothetical protein